MLYSKLVEVYEELEKTSARLGKIDAVARILRETETNNLPRVVQLLQGKVFPNWSEFETGIADKIIIKIVSTATGFNDKEVM